MGEDRVQGLAFGSGKVIVGMLHACYSQSDPDGSLTAGVTFSRGDSPGAQNPQVYGNLGNGSLVAYRPDGTKAWTSASSRQVLAAGPSRLIAKCSEGPGVCAVDRATGVRVWRRANVTPTTATLVGAGLLIVNRGPENSAAAFNAANGQPVSIYTVAGKVDSKFQASNGRLIEETGRVLTVYAPTRPWWQTRAVSRRPP